MNYFDQPFISNSMLSDYEKKLFNLQSYGNRDKANQFGQLVHCLILEKDCFCVDTSLLSEDEINTIGTIAKIAYKHPFIKWLRQWTKKEKEVYWNEENTALPCKSKLDCHFKKTVIDLKTTSAKSEKQFKKSIIDFNYHRQGAFYIDSVQAKRFIIVGLQKQEPFNIWKVEISKSELQIGRKRYLALLKHAHKNGHFNTLLNRNESINNIGGTAILNNRGSMLSISPDY